MDSAVDGNAGPIRSSLMGDGDSPGRRPAGGDCCAAADGLYCIRMYVTNVNDGVGE